MTHPLRIKICGVTTPDAVRAAADLGVDAIGINFHPGSRRFVDPRAAAPLLRAVPPLMTAVGVFVNQPFRQVGAVAYQLGLRAVQWYGDPREAGDPFPFSLIPAFRVKEQAHLDAIRAYLDDAAKAGHLPGAVLIDALVEGQMGGTGHKAPWELLASFRCPVPLILAGGLTPENVADAVRLVRPAGVDVASGVESSPGRKDPEKVQRFIAAAREAATGLSD
jgi:phosphoribosylanthranilate isomerase